jgi:transketolase
MNGSPLTPTTVATDELALAARIVRGDVLDMSYRAKTPHLGSTLSCVDIVTALYWTNPALDSRLATSVDRDRVILSKGHAATVLYSVLARRGFFPLEDLQSYACDGSPLAEHPILGTVAGVEVTSGSLGHGLPLGLGLALAGRLQDSTRRVYVVMSDGECNEGVIWEAAMFAAAQRLDRVAVIVDYNKWQATGRSDEVLALAPLAEKWRAFGWDAVELDGHDLPALARALSRIPSEAGRPTAIIAHTIKGKGVSFMEDDNNWHYRIPTADELRRARQELGLE